MGKLLKYATAAALVLTTPATVGMPQDNDFMANRFAFDANLIQL